MSPNLMQKEEITMRKIKRCIGILLVAVLFAGLLAGCYCTNLFKPDKTAYYGTWASVDNELYGDSPEIHYLIFDENGYWLVYIYYITMLNCMKGGLMPCDVDLFLNTDRTTETYGCQFTYFERTDYTDRFEIDANGNLYEKVDPTDLYTKYSENTGYPEDAIIEECRELFERAEAEIEARKIAEIEEKISTVLETVPVVAGFKMTFADGIETIFHDYEWEFEPYTHNNYSVTFTGNYSPLPYDYPNISWSGSITFLVDVGQGTITVQNDPNDIHGILTAMSFRR